MLLRARKYFKIFKGLGGGDSYEYYKNTEVFLNLSLPVDKPIVCSINI